MEGGAVRPATAKIIHNGGKRQKRNPVRRPRQRRTRGRGAIITDLCYRVKSNNHAELGAGAKIARPFHKRNGMAMTRQNLICALDGT